MKIKWLGILLVAHSAAMAQTVFTDGIDVSNQAVRGVGLIDLGQLITNPVIFTMASSIAQLSGIDSNGTSLATNYLLTIRALELVTDGIYARTGNGLTFYDSANNAILKIQGGAFLGNGAGLTNLTPAQISGLGSAALVSSNFFVATNATQLGEGAKSDGDSVAVGFNADGSGGGVAVGRQALAMNYGVAVGQFAIGTPYGAALGRCANGTNFGTAVGCNASGVAYGAALGDGANGGNWGTASGGYADGSIYGAAVGWVADGSWFGASMGYHANSTVYGVAIGARADGHGMGNVALGGSDTNSTAALVPSGWQDTVELGRGTAALQGGLNFRGKGIVNSAGVVVAAINTTNLTVTGTANLILVPGDLNMGSFTNQPGM